MSTLLQGTLTNMSTDFPGKFCINVPLNYFSKLCPFIWLLQSLLTVLSLSRWFFDSGIFSTTKSVQ